MNKLDRQYQALLRDILDNGVTKQDRTGTGTISVFGRQIRHTMSEGFPLITTKKMPFKTITTELLWFLRGDTNIKFLVNNNCHIWDGDAYKAYCKIASAVEEPDYNIHVDDPNQNCTRLMTMGEFINKIKINDAFAKEWGELGPIYGKQWRGWNGLDKDFFINTDNMDDPLVGGHGLFYQPGEIDQIANLISELKTNPDSRRLMVNAWNVGELNQMVLPPCHYGFQVYTRVLSLKERVDYFNSKMHKEGIRTQIATVNVNEEYWKTSLEQTKHNIPTRAISLMWNQRSVDTFLGLPFNIASYGLLLEIIAKEVNMVPEELIGNLGDTHLYSNHIEQAKEQIGRKYTPEEREAMLKDAMSWRLYNKAVNEIMPFGGGMSEYYEAYKIPYCTREPYPLPTLKHMKTEAFYKSLSEDVSLVTHLDNTDFEIQNYQSHPSIKGELSN
jgi:thymidylate synthase